MSYRGELRCGVRALKRSIAAMGEREAESFTGPHLQPLRDALRAQYGCLLYRATTILETEAGDDDPPNEEGERLREHVEEMRDTLVMLIAELPTRGSLHYTVLREHLAELSRLQIMRSVVFDCVRERLEQESRSRGT